MIEFTPYPKTARLFKDGLGMVVTEKLDGTNAAVVITEGKDIARVNADRLSWAYVTEVEVEGREYTVAAQSRNRMIAPALLTGDKGSDNYGFANWVFDNAQAMARVCGPGVHFGEWWGQGIARNYGLTEKRFSLFNTSRFAHLDNPAARLALGCPGQLGVVPVLYHGELDTTTVIDVLFGLDGHSVAAPGFDKPEGICVYLPFARQTFKVTYEGDKPKWEVAAQAGVQVAS